MSEKVYVPLLVTAPGQVAVVAGLGRFWIPDGMKEDTILRVLAAGQEWDPLSTAIYSACVQAGDVVMDIGAFNGVRTLRLAQLVGDEGLVYAWEPQADLRAQLHTNLMLNGVTNVVVLPFAASGTAGARDIWLNKANRGGSSLHRGEDAACPGGKVKALPVDALLPDRRISFLKIDVEGHEQEMLCGARRLLQRDRPALYIEIWTDPQRRKAGATDSQADVFGRLESLGYRVPPIDDWGRPDHFLEAPSPRPASG